MKITLLLLLSLLLLELEYSIVCYIEILEGPLADEAASRGSSSDNRRSRRKGISRRNDNYDI